MSIFSMVSCRICNNKDLRSFLNLGPQPLANSFLKKEHINEPETFYPLEACFCSKCHFVQLGYVVDPEALFRNYMYFSSNSESAQRHYGEFAKDIAENVLNKKCFVIEIASNDGILLKNFKKYDISALGIEPAENVAAAAKQQGVDTWVDFFCERTAKNVSSKYGKANVIIGTNVFAHVPDLDDMARGLDILLAEDGVAVFESPYLVDLLENLEFDTIYHEHCSYISVTPLDYFFNRFKMEIYDVKRTSIHGGSLRFYVKRKSYHSHPISPDVKKLKILETDLGLDKWETYEKFSKRVLSFKNELVLLLTDLKSKGKRIIGYGAAAKGNVLLNYVGIGPEILDFIADKSPYKHGYYTPGKHIPIVSTDKITESGSDYMLILAWNFADEIMKQQAWFKKKGGKFIIPIPHVKIV